MLSNVKSINITGIFMGNENYLSSFLLPMLDRMRELYSDYKFYYYFYADDKEGDKTCHLLKRYVKGKKGSKVMTNTARPGKFKRDTDLLRIKNIERARNELLKLRPFEGDITILLDSDTYFDVNILNRFLHADYPHDWGVISCNGKDHTKCQTHLGNCKHYYDTLALIDLDGNLGYNFTRTNGFQCCPFQSQNDRDDWFSGNIVQVKSAFGGMSFYKTSLINDPKLVYKVETHFKYVHDGSYLFCEHWDFIRSLCCDDKYCVYVDPKLIVCNLEL